MRELALLSSFWCASPVSFVPCARTGPEVGTSFSHHPAKPEKSKSALIRGKFGIEPRFSG